MQGSSSPDDDIDPIPPYPSPYPSPYPFPYPQPRPPPHYRAYPPHPLQAPNPPPAANPNYLFHPPTQSFDADANPSLRSNPLVYPLMSPPSAPPLPPRDDDDDDDDDGDPGNAIIYPSITSPNHHHYHHHNPIHTLLHPHRHSSQQAAHQEGSFSSAARPVEYPRPWPSQPSSASVEDTIPSSSASVQNGSYFSGPLQRPTPSIDFEDSIQTFHNGGGWILSGQGKKANHSLRYHLLYGTLDLYIHSAKNLPNMDMFSETLRQVITAGLPNIVKTGIPVVSKVIKSDPYVCLILGGACLARTDVISNSSDPVWNQHFVVNVAHKVAEIEFLVKDNDMIGAQYIGEVKIPSARLLTSPHAIVKESFPLLNRDGKPSKQGAELCISVTYWPIAQDPLYRYGVGMDHLGVCNAYFPLRRGCRLTLYQDAHMPHEFQPPILLAGGRGYERRSCWDDICQAILDAQHLIYIAGWSIYTEITLVRDKERWRPDEAYLNLGELLKWKAQSGGVRVLLLVWDDRTSSTFHKTGIMATHDEETREFFRHSRVDCLLAPRVTDSKLSFVKQQVDATLFSHHQKLVIVDTEAPNFPSKRNLAAFIGGLDLCNGRYDTPEHSLFCKLDTVFRDDYHNPIFPLKTNIKGPRQPWHDLHCKIEGPAVYDVLENFEQRWRKISKWHTRFHDILIDLNKASWIVAPNEYITEESDYEKWYVQVFRSIDSGSVKNFPKDPELKNLIVQKNIKVDMSIQTAYIKAIRSAQHFIYIENQYFLGSSFAWPKYKNAGSNHLVPMELALKIVSKIKAHEDFAVYILIPMWPEGDPLTNPVQEILFFQSQTMEMMYTLIAEALKEERLDGIRHPTDYLNFFCLGNREPGQLHAASPVVTPNDRQFKVLKSRRFMIYVHSKGMVVDDEYVIIGSANINQRSMDGSRDTEIAMGAYQPCHTWAHNRQAPRGQVHGYRMSLWVEHLGANNISSYLQPWKLECVKMVQHLAAQNWKQYTAEEVTKMDGHLLPYPLKVEGSGKVVSLENFECFPDVGGKILGVSTSLPDRVTT